MAVSFLYLMARRVTGMLLASLRSAHAKDVEIAVLRQAPAATSLYRPVVGRVMLALTRTCFGAVGRVPALCGQLLNSLCTDGSSCDPATTERRGVCGWPPWTWMGFWHTIGMQLGGVVLDMGHAASKSRRSLGRGVEHDASGPVADARRNGGAGAGGAGHPGTWGRRGPGAGSCGGAHPRRSGLAGRSAAGHTVLRAVRCGRRAGP